MSSRRPFRWLFAAVAVASPVVGCAADSDDSVQSASSDGVEAAGPAEPGITVPADLEDLTGQAEVVIEVRDNVFDPRNIVVSPGTEVIWMNEGDNNHNVVPAAEGSFEVTGGGELAGSEDPPTEGSATFADAGEFSYYCSLHGTANIGQTGFILVDDA